MGQMSVVARNHSQNKVDAAAAGGPRRTGHDLRNLLVYKEVQKPQPSCAAYNLIIGEIKLNLFLYIK